MHKPFIHAAIATHVRGSLGVLATFLVVGCGSSSTAVQNNPPPLEESTVQADSAPTKSAAVEPGFSGDFEGTYTCEQGLTGVYLTLEVADDKSAKALFDFYPVDSNPDVPRGSFRMRGVIDDGAIRLDADETDWISQPHDGWVTIDLDGKFDESRNTITGNVLLPVCSTFELIRKQ